MGAAWNYYAEEGERYKHLNKRGTFEEYLRALKKLCRHFKLHMPVVRRTSGRRWSRANGSRITLNMDTATWRTVYHELGHTFHMQKYYKHGIRTVWHGKVHRKLMARICRYAEKKGWHTGTLKKVETPKPVRVMSLEQCKLEETQKKIARREAQIKRLASRIKSLSTRLSKAKRSLGALRRSAEKLDVIAKSQPPIETNQLQAAAAQ